MAEHDLDGTRVGAGLGSRGHVQETLGRARAAIRAARELAAHELAAHGRTVLARAQALADAPEHTVQTSLAIRAQLRASVTAYVRCLKADGMPSERMLVLVKSAVREATPPELDTYEARELMEDVVRWSIEAFYHAA